MIEIEKLTTVIAQVRDLQRHFNYSCEMIAARDAQLSTMRAALGFYGQYIVRNTDGYCHVMTPVEHDCGDKARTALAGKVQS